MEIAHLALGSNIGDSVGSIRRAVTAIDADANCRVIGRSSFYLTKPVGVEDQPDFVNAVVSVETSLEPRKLLALCKHIEQKLGRTRTIRWGPRVIDIDVLVYGDRIIEEEDFTVPHPRMMERAFVMIPLAELAPGLKLSGGVTAEEAARRIGMDGIELMEGVSWDTNGPVQI